LQSTDLDSATEAAYPVHRGSGSIAVRLPNREAMRSWSRPDRKSVV